jgi:four helix bundle protein
MDKEEIDSNNECERDIGMTPEEPEERLIDFAVAVMSICGSLPRTFEGKHIGEQLFRSGTSAAANDAEVRGAESMRDFVRKLGVVRQELNESQVWIRRLQKNLLSTHPAIPTAVAECSELCCSISASRRTAESTIRRKEALGSQS